MSKHFREGFKKATCQCLKSGKMTGLPSMVVEESVAIGKQNSPSKFCCKHQDQGAVVGNIVIGNIVLEEYGVVGQRRVIKWGEQSNVWWCVICRKEKHAAIPLVKV